MSEQPGLAELRRALRITEPGGGGASVAPAPLLADRLIDPLAPPSSLHGTWRGELENREQVFIISAEDVVYFQVDAGVEGPRRSLRTLIEQRVIYRLRVGHFDDGRGYTYNGALFGEDLPLEDSFIQDADQAGQLHWSRLGADGPGPQATLLKVE